MKNHEIVFTLNEQEKIVVELAEPLDLIGCCDGAPIFFVRESEKFKLDSDDLRWDMDSLSGLLVEALRNRLVLHASLSSNLGSLITCYRFYSFDREKAGQEGLIFDEDDEWVGHRHLLFAN